ncbi:hypothetical protein BX600DRAFT_452448 [Xylariales sp. PMI_506]|nr:hypothetical protein BX600DRAFT_452448 [Xylariales sp. PMI_506]
MPSSRKRSLREAEPEPEPDKKTSHLPEENSLLHQVRNTWQFANLFQWIFLFGKAVKIDESIDIDVLETECLKPSSSILADIGLALLKFVSSHRGLTPELFDEYTRRQYVAKRPESNPFGTGEEPARFHDFNVFTKLRVLQQLTQWVMLHPERIREKMDEQKVTDQTDWRIEPYGWDSEDREYYLLDDDRLYRRTEAPPAPVDSTWKPKRNTKKAKAAARAAKRRRVSRSAAADADDSEAAQASDAEGAGAEPEDDGFGGAKWECIAVTLNEVRAFLHSLRKTRDENEKILRDRIEEGLVPILEKHEESRKRKELAREKELLNLAKMANAKRSSRIASKVEQKKHEETAREEEERRRKEEVVARKEEQQRLKREKERDNRLMSREKRLKEREVRRQQYQEELAQLSEDSRHVASDATGRLSERRLQAEIAKNKQALQELEEDEDEDDWIFDCVCGVYGQVDDGTHSIACEKCNVWQHSKCVGVGEEEADHEDFHFICNPCKRKAANPKPTVIKLKLKGPGDASSSSPPSAKKVEATAAPSRGESQQAGWEVEIPSQSVPKPDTSPSVISPSTRIQPPVGTTMLQSSQPQSASLPMIPVKPSGQLSILPPPSPYTNGEGSNPFSSPHPTLSPPQQSPNKLRAYSTIIQSSPPIPSSRGGNKILPPKGIFHTSPKPNGALKSLDGSPSTLPPHADVTVPSIAARSDSPLKLPIENASNSVRVLSPPSVSFSAPARPPSSSNTPSILSTPQLKHTQPGPLSNINTPTLPPFQNGISPLKRSPPPAPHSSNSAHSTPAPAILPPITLSPTPSQQIMTPPVKPAEPIRPASRQSSGAAGDV